MAMKLQELIHSFEVGGGARVMRWLTAGIVMVSLAVWYDLAAFRNLSTQEGMDAAQLARNLADGNGYTTDFIRPFSMYLLSRHRSDHDAQVKQAHPDLANPPVYPVILAGVLKTMPFGYPDVATSTKSPRYLPDLWIGVFNQLVFFVAVFLVFRLGKRLFDEPVAWFSAVVFLGADLFWQFSLSGLSTMLLVVIFLALVEVLARVEPETRAGTRGPGWFWRMGLLAGALTGVGGLTRYAFGWMIVPVLAFFALAPGQRRQALLMSALAGFLIVTGPWLARNLAVSGTPFGTAGYAICQNTSAFPAGQLERTQNADFKGLTGGELWHKFLVGARDIVEKDLPRLGGNWVSAFFLAGLLMPFRNLMLGRLRLFLVISLAVLGIAQALGRTHLTTDSPEVNSENLLAVLAPLVFIYGVSLFFILLEQLSVKTASARITVIVLAGGLACAPLGFTLVLPPPGPLVYPPYFPAGIQEKARNLQLGEWMMSDIPWAVAWYGHQPCVALSLKYRNDPADRYKNDFYELNDVKPVNALYLSGKTVQKLETEPLQAWAYREPGENWERFVSSWEDFVMTGLLASQQVPTGFPLTRTTGLLPEVFLTHSERKSGKNIKLK